MIAALAPVLAPVFLIVALGYGWARLKRPWPAEFITGLMTQVGTPALAFSTMTGFDLDLASFTTMAVASLVAVAGFAAAGAAVLAAARMPIAPYLPCIMLPNTGNMGLPLALFAFGEAGLALAVSITVVIMVLHHTVGAALSSGRVSLRAVLAQPILWAVLAGMAVIGFELAVPAWLKNTVDLMGGMVIPLMLTALGVSLAKLTVKTVRPAAVVALARLGLGFPIGLGVAALFGLEGAAAGVMILQCTMPVAVYNYLYTALFNGPEEDVAGAVVLSTVISFLTLPFLVGWLIGA